MSNNVEYDLDALKTGIQKCKKNVKIFEDAIEQEHTTIREYRRMISALEEKKALTNDNKNGRFN
jgi:hypothetical protein